MNPPPNSNQIRDFLLNRLPPEQAEEIEERMFQDEAYFSELQDAEDELIEEYATESLDSAEAQLFEARLAGDPNLQERVTIRRVLVRTLQGGTSGVPAAVAAKPRSMRSLWGRFLVPGFALAILILFFISYKAEHRNALPPQGPETAAASAPGASANRPEAMSQAAAVLFLPAHGSRGAAQPPSVLHVGSATLVRLELETPTAETSARWDVRISDAGGSVFTAAGLKPQQAGVVSYVVAEVPASQLPPKAYRVTLSPQATGGAALSWDLQVAQ